MKLLQRITEVKPTTLDKRERYELILSAVVTKKEFLELLENTEGLEFESVVSK